MESRALKYIAESCGGELMQGSPLATVSGLCTDSRRVQRGALFFALVGDHFDGHDFLEQVAAQGVAAVVSNKLKLPAKLKDCAMIAVDDTRAALGKLAARYRQDFALPVIAVGGSNGKTTTKELLGCVLGEKHRTLRSEASFNNHIGVPVTLLGLDRAHRAAVLEVGTNHPGELAPLVRMIAPRYGVLTSLGREHLEFFGDLEGVAREEGWLAELLPAEGKLFVNGDGAGVEAIVARARAQVVRVGQTQKNNWQVTEARLDERGTFFRVQAPNHEFSGEYRLKLLGRHQAINALLAVAVGAELGLSREEIQRGLAKCLPPKMRLAMWTSRGVRVLDDAYNANADSTLAALATLRELPCAGRRVAVLGDMAELGGQSEVAHREVGQRAAQLGIQGLFTIGKWAGVTGSAARAAGLNEVAEFDTVEAAWPPLNSYLEPGDLVLLKASRAARFERLGEALRKSGEARGENELHGAVETTNHRQASQAICEISNDGRLPELGHSITG
jgi:UDP-N-acetylmuramoyl-tripeptide--D-alanyl-D-alanine ligase